MNQQEIFDKVCTHLMTQRHIASGPPPECLEGRFKTSSERICMYRAPNGDSCAAGCLISDEEYEPSMENKTFLQITVDFPEKLQDIRMHDYLIGELQRAHDYGLPESVKKCAEMLRTTANYFGLIVPAIVQKEWDVV